MKFLEKDLEDIIWETDNEILTERGLEIYGDILLRQKRIGNYGIADLICINNPSMITNELGDSYIEQGVINIFELKKDKISVSSLLQVIRYAKGVKTYLEKRKKDHLFVIQMTLVGREIDLNSDLVYVTDFIEDLYLFTYDIDINGLKFKEHSRNYDLINKGF